MEEFKYAQEGLDKLFEKIGRDRRTGETRKQRRKRERHEAKLAKNAKRREKVTA